jgi:hypothetical protein
MEDIKARVEVVLGVVERGVTVGRPDFDAEVACLNLRKILELIAFASLTANKEKYAEVHANFANHWRAKVLLQNLERIHPQFYPRPAFFSHQDANGIKHIDFLKDGFLTKDEFVTLYDKCSEVLHTWNPFRVDPRVVDFGISIRDWVTRIERLLAVHTIRLIEGDVHWLVYMQHPEDGKVHALTAMPVDAAI